MFHPLLTVLIRKPDLVVEHLAGYGALVHEEVSSLGTEIALRAVAWVVAAVMVSVFITLTGVALMLGALHGSLHWALVAVPLVTLFIAVSSFFYARKPLSDGRFAEIKAQVDADIQALRLAGERK